MLYIKTNLAPYEKIRHSLDAVYPDAQTEHISTDYALKSLGFTDHPPCVFSLNMTWDEYDQCRISQIEQRSL